MARKKRKLSSKECDEAMLGWALFSTYAIPFVALMFSGQFGGAAVFGLLSLSVLVAQISGCRQEPEKCVRQWVDCARQSTEAEVADKT